MSDPSANPPLPKWKTTMATYEGLPLALRVRPMVDTAENRTAFPHLAIVSHELAQVKSNGLPQDDYNHSLMEFDLGLQSALAGANDGFVFLVETFSGNRNYYGCVADEPATRFRIDQFRASYPQHTLTLRVHHGKAWEFYNDYRRDFPW